MQTSLYPLLCSVIISVFGVTVLWFFSPLHHVAEESQSSPSLTFNIPPRDPVAMTIHNTHRYEVSSSGVEDFTALLPPGGHLVHLGSPPKAYTPTLLHQMKCLEIIQAALVDVPADSAATATPLVSHCLNYLRQNILCRPNLRLESVTNVNASSEKEYETVCRDWEAVYAATEQNQVAFAALRQ